MVDISKRFRITDGKGFHITFANGHLFSCQWGWGNYCDHYDKFPTSNYELGAEGSNTAEIMAVSCGDDGEGDVEPRCTPETVLDHMVRTSLTGLPMYKLRVFLWRLIRPLERS